uniref:Schlafen AlbA-2 domain-containing protein n=1 Tax=Amphimedon queenslandica TaxID=400682 RepID=A0A1X7TJT6_AMPQE
MADSSMVYTLTPELSFSPSTARAKTTYKIGSKLVNTETRHTEYKVGNFALNNLEQHIRKYGSAFLNSGGGTLTIGIADDGTVVGVNISSESRIKRIISDEFKAFKPSVGSSYYEVDFVPTDEWDRFIIEIHIRAGEDDEIYADGEDKLSLILIKDFSWHIYNSCQCCCIIIIVAIMTRELIIIIIILKLNPLMQYCWH